MTSIPFIRAVSDPQWLAENLRVQFRRRLARRRPLLRADIDRYAVPLASVWWVLGISPAEHEPVIGHAWREQTLAPESSHDASENLLEVVWAVTRHRRPLVVVETGVAQGLTSAVFLAAMDANGSGHLHSIDLPSLRAADARPGAAVPDALRGRWSLHLGSSRRLLPVLLRDLKTIDLFLHDADHTYDSQMEEYRTAWPSIIPGGLLLSDDVCNRAFVDFAEGLELMPYLVAQGKSSPLGILIKPGGD